MNLFLIKLNSIKKEKNAEIAPMGKIKNAPNKSFSDKVLKFIDSFESEEHKGLFSFTAR